MMDFSKIKEPYNRHNHAWEEYNNEEFTPMPAGKYLCRAVNYSVSRTQHRDEMWNITYVVIQGDYTGRKVWDNLVFSENAMNILKMKIHRLGIDLEHVLLKEITPDDLMGRAVWLDVIQEKYDNKTRNKIDLPGYTAVDEANKETGAADIPL